MGSLKHLHFVSLGANSFDPGQVPANLGNLTMLRVLNLRTCNRIGTIPPGLGRLGLLSELELSGNQLTGHIPPALGNLSQLSNLRVQANLLSGSVPSTIGHMISLVQFNIGHNSLQGDLSFLSSLSSCKELLVITLNSNNFTGRLPADYLGNLSSQLQEIDAFDNK